MTTEATASVTQLQARLKRSADPARASAQQAYLKSPLRHLGLRVGEVRRIERGWVREQGAMSHDELWEFIGELWRSPIYELRFCAVDALSYRVELLGPADLPELRTMIGGTFTWALVDPLSIDVVGRVVEGMGSAEVDAVLDPWSTDTSFWVRRASLLCQMRVVRGPGDSADRFFRYADAMLDEKEFFIRKAIGWVLRDMSRRRPDVVFDWLRPRADRASTVTIREAVKYLSADQRQDILDARVRRPNERD